MAATAIPATTNGKCDCPAAAAHSARIGQNVGKTPATSCVGSERKYAMIGSRLTTLITFTTAKPATWFGAAIGRIGASVGADRAATVAIGINTLAGSGVTPISG